MGVNHNKNMIDIWEIGYGEVEKQRKKSQIIFGMPILIKKYNLIKRK